MRGGYREGDELLGYYGRLVGARGRKMVRRLCYGINRDRYQDGAVVTILWLFPCCGVESAVSPYSRLFVWRFC